MQNETQQSVGEWAEETFPGGQAGHPRNAIRLIEEVGEFARAYGLTMNEVWLAIAKGFPSDMKLYDRRPESPEKVAKEMADMDIVMDVVAHRDNINRQREKNEKMGINRGREWHQNGDGTGYHIKREA